jgi:hypothetical protein
MKYLSCVKPFRAGRFFFFLLAMCLCITNAYARIYPHNGAVLSQVHVMFEYDEIAGADAYKVVVVPAYASPGMAPVIVMNNTSLAVPVTSGLQFGSDYQWYFEAYKAGKKIYRSGELSFTIKNSPLTDTNLYRAKVTLAQKGKYPNDILLLDNIAAAMDRSGKIVWFLPAQSDSVRGPFRNVQLTKDGTITYLDNSDCFELALTGEPLWKAPNDGKVSGAQQEFYHHDFTKLPDGTYLCAGYQYVDEKNYYDNSITCKVRYNTLIQYNAAGELLWSWSEKYHSEPAQMFAGIASTATSNEGTHLNGFSYDKAASGIVMSFRNSSAIYKIDHQTGDILYNLATALNGVKKGGSTPYNSQHGPFVMPNGNILVYNNNSSSEQRISWPVVQMFSQPTATQPAKKVWEYECRSAAFPNGIRGKEGYAMSLPNGHILVCMGGVNFGFEVTMDKQVVWECFFEKWDTPVDGEPSWKPFSNYRMHAVSSLYPRYFTVQQLTRSWQLLAKNKSQLQVQVNNEGSDADTYTVTLTDVNGKIIATKPITVKPRTKAVVQLPFLFKKETVQKRGDSYGTITVSPTDRPAMKRDMSVGLF